MVVLPSGTPKTFYLLKKWTGSDSRWFVEEVITSAGVYTASRNNSVESASASSSGELLVCGGSEGSFRVVQAASGALLATLYPCSGSIEAEAFHLTLPFCALASNDGNVQLLAL